MKRRTPEAWLPPVVWLLTTLAVAIFVPPFAVAMELCAGGPRVDCVVDGDTLWIAGEKIRLKGVDAPEVHGACRRERELAGRATKRLRELSSAGPLRVTRAGRDRYGRTLAYLTVGGRDIGTRLIEEGYAVAWPHGRSAWCDVF